MPIDHAAVTLTDNATPLVHGPVTLSASAPGPGPAVELDPDDLPTDPGQPGEEEIARRAELIAQSTGVDAFASWTQAERELRLGVRYADVRQRAFELFREGSLDTLGNWLRAEREAMEAARRKG